MNKKILTLAALVFAAHSLGNPFGNSYTPRSSLDEKTEQVQRESPRATARRAALEKYYRGDTKADRCGRVYYQ